MRILVLREDKWIAQVTKSKVFFYITAIIKNLTGQFISTCFSCAKARDTELSNCMPFQKKKKKPTRFNLLNLNTLRENTANIKFKNKSSPLWSERPSKQVLLIFFILNNEVRIFQLNSVKFVTKVNKAQIQWISI